LAEQIGAPLCLRLDVTDDAERLATLEAIAEKWGRLDILVHSIAFAPHDDLHGRVVDCSLAGFLKAMDISVHSFIRLVRGAEPLMSQGGTCLAMSFYGAEKVISTYNVMGPVKAALEAVVRELASELGESDIRVNALSPGPMATRAASGISNFDSLMQEAIARAPLRRLADIDDVGAFAAFLASRGGRNITGGTFYVDAGFHIMGS
jgi:enoyl-[acyl-carrier protein] reductase I